MTLQNHTSRCPLLFLALMCGSGGGGLLACASMEGPDLPAEKSASSAGGSWGASSGGNDGAGASGGSDGAGASGGSDGAGASGGSDGGGASGGNDGAGASGGNDGAGGNSSQVSLPPENGTFDYQIGGAYDPPNGVVVVSRDRQEDPAAGVYNICYVNGFQVQPDEESWWLEEHPELILRDDQDEPVIDPDWDEMLLDTSTPEKRTALAEIIGSFIEGCASNGFDAVEIDNLDTYSRSGGRLSQDNNVAFMGLLSDVAHSHGLASGQKNSTEILDQANEMKTDFAVAEECNRYDECGDYQEVYGNLVFVIEYRDQDFDKGCADFPELSIVRRDLNVSSAGSAGYVFDEC